MNSILLAVGIFLGLGLISSVLLVVLSRSLAIPEAEEVQQVRNVLPGINCGVCGYSGCDGYAKACAEDKIVPNRCIPGGADVSRAISEITGVASGGMSEQVAWVHCRGNFSARRKKYEYRGIRTCVAVNTFYRGDATCNYGCLGMGDCVKVCAYDAIHVIDGVAIVDPDKCTGCLMCTKKCPKNLIHPTPKATLPKVSCMSHATGKETRLACKNGCIACMRCEKVCEFDAIHVINNLAVVDNDKCTRCGKCVEACPVKVIRWSFPQDQHDAVVE